MVTIIQAWLLSRANVYGQVTTLPEHATAREVHEIG